MSGLFSFHSSFNSELFYSACVVTGFFSFSYGTVHREILRWSMDNSHRGIFRSPLFPHRRIVPQLAVSAIQIFGALLPLNLYAVPHIVHTSTWTHRHTHIQTHTHAHSAVCCVVLVRYAVLPAIGGHFDLLSPSARWVPAWCKMHFTIYF